MDTKKEKKKRRKENQIHLVLFNPRSNRISPVHFSNSLDKQSTHRPHFDNIPHKESLPRARYSFVVAKHFTGLVRAGVSVRLVSRIFTVVVTREKKNTRTCVRDSGAREGKKKSHFRGWKIHEISDSTTR